MSKLLVRSDSFVPSTATKLARRMLASSRVLADHLPIGIAGSPAVDILLALYVSEEDALYGGPGDLNVPTSLSEVVTSRWVMALINMGLVEGRANLLALTAEGHRMMTDMLEALYLRQRQLD